MQTTSSNTSEWMIVIVYDYTTVRLTNNHHWFTCSLALNRRQAILWSNENHVHWYLMALLGHNELSYAEGLQYTFPVDLCAIFAVRYTHFIQPMCIIMTPQDASQIPEKSTACSTACSGQQCKSHHMSILLANDRCILLTYKVRKSFPCHDAFMVWLQRTKDEPVDFSNKLTRLQFHQGPEVGRINIRPHKVWPRKSDLGGWEINAVITQWYFLNSLALAEA